MGQEISNPLDARLLFDRNSLICSAGLKNSETRVVRSVRSRFGRKPKGGRCSRSDEHVRQLARNEAWHFHADTPDPARECVSSATRIFYLAIQIARDLGSWLLPKRVVSLNSDHMREFRRLPSALHSDASLRRGEFCHYPIPFVNSGSVLSTVTAGECSYSPIDSTYTSRSTARQIE